MSILETQTYAYWAAQQARRKPGLTEEVRGQVVETIRLVAKNATARSCTISLPRRWPKLITRPAAMPLNAYLGDR